MLLTIELVVSKGVAIGEEHSGSPPPIEMLFQVFWVNFSLNVPKIH